MAEKKSLLSKVRAAVKKVTTKPQVKKTAVKSVSGLRKFKSYTSKSNEKYTVSYTHLTLPTKA